MEQFFKDFEKYCTEASYGSFWFWGIPIVTVLGIWLLTTVGIKIFRSPGKLKTAFLVNKAWIISSLIAAFAIIAVICYCWSQNIFAAASEDYRLSWLIALTVALVIPIIAFLNLRRYYNQENIKEVTDQPTTKLQLDATIPLLKRAYERIKWFYIIPVFAFLFLLFHINKGTNLISIVYDNSPSMVHTNAIDALQETIEKLEENNEIILTTLDGYPKDGSSLKSDLKEIMVANQSSALKAGNVIAYNNPKSAANGLSAQLSNPSAHSPIAESVWKMWLVVNESKANQIYKNKLLIIITDGDDPICSTLQSGSFFFSNTKFAEYFTPENVYVVDFSGGNKLQFCTNNFFIQCCTDAGCNIFEAENSKSSYIDALDEALQSFKNNWNYIFWTIFIVALFTIIALLIPPKKII